jgi:FkbM family methyltransferase
MKDKKSNIKLGGLFYPKSVDGVEIPFDSLYLPYIWREIYFEGLYIDTFNQKKDMVVIDYGANCGLVTQWMRPYCKKLYAVEPSVEHFEALKKNKEFNGWDNVEIFKEAVAEVDGEMTISKLANNLTCNSLGNNYGDVGEKVPTRRIDTFMKDNNIEEVDFIKMDIENYEDVVLRSEGFLNVAPKIKSIMLEFHNAQWPKLVEHMMSLGYKARRYESSAVVVLFFR